MQARAGSRNFEIPRATGVSTRELRTCDTKTADDTNEPFPIDTETLKDVVRGGASVPQERMRVGIVSGSGQVTYHDISYLWEYTRTEARNFTVSFHMK